MNRPVIIAATLALASIRAVLAGLCVIVGLDWAGDEAFLAAAWYGIPAVFVAMGFRWALWLTVAMNGATLGVGLLVLPGFGRLHGGEVFAFASVPAVLELVLAVYLIRLRAKRVEPAG